MSVENLLEQTAEALGRVRNEAELRRGIEVWAPRFHPILSKAIKSGERPELKLDVATIPGRGGWAIKKGDSFFVGIGDKGNRERRFTFAHEVGHVVLAMSHLDESLLGGREESLCELFARRALIPPALARSYLREVGTPSRLADLSRFADRFRVSLRASLVALDELIPEGWPVALVIASWREHPRGDGVLGLRVDASACDRRILFPIDCRLSTLGYSGLEAWVGEAQVGARGNGCEETAKPKSRWAGISGWRGESRWVAERHLRPGGSAKKADPAALCALDLRKLEPLPSRPRRRAAGSLRKRPIAPIPGQLDFER